MSVGGRLYPPGKHETHQRADEYHHLVEHGGVGSLDGPVEVVLHGWGLAERQTDSKEQKVKSW